MFSRALAIYCTCALTIPAWGQLVRSPGNEPRSFSVSAARVSNAPASIALSFEDPGVIRIDHSDPVCLTSDRPGKEQVLIHEPTVQLPAFANTGIVIAAGWRLRYTSGDHHIAQLGSEIDALRIVDGTLRWGAIGVLRDKNFDDGYEWCYYYTTVAWNTEVIDAVPNFSVPTLGFALSAQHAETDVALATASLFDADEAFAGKSNVVPIANGFLLDWGGNEFADAFPGVADDQQEDHHLLHLGVDQGAAETFIENRDYDTAFAPVTPNDASFDRRFVSWDTQVIFKDNDDKRKFFYLEDYSSLGGNDIGVITPPFSMQPVEDTSSCLRTRNGVETVERVVENIPFDYAVPMLSGWELKYECNDEHVRELGIWLHDIEYAKPRGAITGTLRFKVSSILTDKNDSPNHSARHNVHILGFNRGAAGPTTPVE